MLAAVARVGSRFVGAGPNESGADKEKGEERASIELKVEMKRRHSISLAAVALVAIAALGFPARAPTTQTEVNASAIVIPVNDPQTKAIAGALFKPARRGPFPVVVYMSGSDGIDNPFDRGLQDALVRHLLGRNIATLVLDPFTPRNERGVTGKLLGSQQYLYYERGAKDLIAAVNALSAMPDVDKDGLFLQGYSYGAVSALFAADGSRPASERPHVAGVIAFYPLCYIGLSPSVPTLALLGAQDEVFPPRLCASLSNDPNIQFVVYPGVTHDFAMPGLLEGDLFGRHQAYDKQAVEDAQRRIDRFIALRLNGRVD